jgi:tRNA threonylcarbamoyladenosine biosynthesis protein TsaE
MSILTSQSENETALHAQSFAKRLEPGDIVALHGDLGAGKTVFAKGIAKALGIHEIITSPTYTIVQEYPTSRGPFYHIDLYRLSTLNDALDFGLEEFVNDDRAITVIEWPERLGDYMTDNMIHVTIAGDSDHRRTIEVKED